MKLNKALKLFESQAKMRDSYWIEKAKLDFAVSLEKQRRQVGMTYSAIAEKLGTSAAYITKVFRGDTNLTIESMVKLARATDSKVHISLVDERFDVKPTAWISAISRHGKRTISVPTNDGNYEYQEARYG